MLSVNPNLPPEEIKQAILDTAVDLGAQGVDEFYGAGRIDAAAAIASTPSGSSGPPPTGKEAELVTDLSNNGIVDPGDTVRYTISVGNTGLASLHDVIVSDTVPANTSYVASRTMLNGIPVRITARQPASFLWTRAG